MSVDLPSGRNAFATQPSVHPGIYLGGGRDNFPIDAEWIANDNDNVTTTTCQSSLLTLKRLFKPSWAHAGQVASGDEEPLLCISICRNRRGLRRVCGARLCEPQQIDSDRRDGLVTVLGGRQSSCGSQTRAPLAPAPRYAGINRSDRREPVFSDATDSGLNSRG